MYLKKTIEFFPNFIDYQKDKILLKQIIKRSLKLKQIDKTVFEILTYSSSVHVDETRLMTKKVLFTLTITTPYVASVKHIRAIVLPNETCVLLFY